MKEKCKLKNKKIDLISLKICREKSHIYSDRRINSPRKAYEVIKDFIGETDREYFGVLNINNANEICSIEVCGIGTIDSALIHPREVFKGAIKCNASKLILFHTHPADSLIPSPSDIAISEDLKQAALIMQIPILDHIIVCSHDFFSFANDGLVFNGA